MTSESRDTGPGASIEALDSFWERSKIGWHTVYLGLLALIAVMIGSSARDESDRLAALLLIAVMAATYGLLGRRILGQEYNWLGSVQLVITWGCFYSLIWMEFYDTYFVLFALIPHIWAFLDTRWAVVATLVFPGGAALLEVAASGWSSDAGRAVAPEFFLQVGLSLLLGLFITGLFKQAEKRAELIDELERTRVELADTEHARGVLAERERLANEIHDTLAQGFTSVLTLAQAVEVAIDRDPPAAPDPLAHGFPSVLPRAQAVEVAIDRDPAAARERLALVESTARENLAEARALVSSLAPVSLQDATLVEAIGRAVERFSHETGVPADLQTEGDARALPANDEVVLLRTVQEALANVRRHAGASRSRIALRFRSGSASAPGSVTAAVVDDGRGFDPNDDTGLGFGLHGMRARVAQAGGTLDVISSPGAGTTVRVTLPTPPVAATTTGT